MKYFGRSVLALGLVVVLPLPVSYATPLNIVVTGGGIGMSKFTPTPFSDVGVFLTGSDFTLTNLNSFSDSFVFSGGNPSLLPHHAGDTVDFSGLVVLSSPSDALFLDGIRFLASGPLNVAVPKVSVASEVSAPFTLTGSIHGQRPQGAEQVTVDVAITGAGTMTAMFEVPGAELMTLRSVSYHVVAPVPEPSAWLLVASGLGAFGLLRRTHRL
jgi:hypothetical protein